MKTIAVIVDFKSHEKVRKLAGELRAVGDLGVVVVDNTEDNIGFAGGVNKGIKVALKRGAERVLLVNPDVKISADLERIDADSDIVSPVLRFRRKGKWVYDMGGKVNWVLGRTTHTEVGDMGEVRGLKKNIEYVSGACMVVKKGVFEKIGFFDERFFLYFEDADFCLRAKAAGLKVAVDPNIIVEHNISEHRFTRDQFKIRQNLKSNFLFIRKWVAPIFWPLALGFMAIRVAREVR
ncbi:glycosyltransferase family 2 protein [Patescibacteria group bacterium]|nr:glycosyltransferase family 2 protein [Patescibacteria group bacterium]